MSPFLPFLGPIISNDLLRLVSYSGQATPESYAYNALGEGQKRGRSSFREFYGPETSCVLFSGQSQVASLLEENGSRISRILELGCRFSPLFEVNP